MESKSNNEERSSFHDDNTIKKVSKLNSFEPTIGSLTNKKRYWGCLTCKALKNDNRSKKCSFCGCARENDRFAITMNGGLYMCRVDTSKTFPVVAIAQVSQQRERFMRLRLPMVADTLLDCVKAAISQSVSESEYVIAPAVSTDSVEKKTTARCDDPSLDLFDRVMKAGQDYAYDANIGQFVHVDTLKDRSDENSGLILKDLQYLKFMKREKVEMGKIVQETISRRNVERVGNALDTTVDRLQEWKQKVPCALCEYMFPPAQLLGTISFKTVAKWKEDHNVPPCSDAKAQAANVYDSARLCLFCTQFFHADYTDTFDVEIAANEDLKKQRLEYVRNEVNSESPLMQIHIGLTLAELRHKKRAASVRQRVLESPADAEVKKLEAERRKLKYLLAKKAFRRHKKEMAAASVSSPATGRSDVSISSAFDASSGSPVRNSIRRGSSSDSVLQSPPKRANSNNSSGVESLPAISRRSQSSEGIQSKSGSYLPSISQTSSLRYMAAIGAKSTTGNSLSSVPEETGQKSNQPRKGKARTTTRGAKCDKRECNDNRKKTSNLSVEHVEAGVMCQQDGGSNAHSLSATNYRKRDMTKESSKPKKPEWVDVRSGMGAEVEESRGRKSKLGAKSVEDVVVPVTAIKLVESATKVYATPVEESDKGAALGPKPRKRRQSVDTSFTRRRRNRNDPRNFIEQDRQRKNRKRRGRCRSGATEPTPEEGIPQQHDAHQTLSDLDRPRGPSPERRMHIIAKHKAPNLTTAKKVRLRPRLKVESPEMPSKELGSEADGATIVSCDSLSRNVVHSAGNGMMRTEVQSSTSSHTAHVNHCNPNSGGRSREVSDDVFTSDEFFNEQNMSNEAEPRTICVSPVTQQACEHKNRDFNTTHDAPCDNTDNVDKDEVLYRQDEFPMENTLENNIVMKNVMCDSPAVSMSASIGESSSCGYADEDFESEIEDELDEDVPDAAVKDSTNTEKSYHSDEFFDEGSVSGEVPEVIAPPSASKERSGSRQESSGDRCGEGSRSNSGRHLSVSIDPDDNEDMYQSDKNNTILSSGMNCTHNPDRITDENTWAPGIELLSGRPISSRHSNRRPSSSTLLPPYENTDPRIIGTGAPQSPTFMRLRRPSPVSAGKSVSSSVLGMTPPGSATRRRIIGPSSPTKINMLQQINSVEQSVNGGGVSSKRNDSVTETKLKTRRMSMPKNLTVVKRKDDNSGRSTYEEKDGDNIDSKRHQKAMESENTAVRSMRKMSAVDSNAVVKDIEGAPTQLDLNIMKAGEMVKRSAVKREDSFDRFTRVVINRKNKGKSSIL